MANPFRDMSVIMQGLVAAAIAVALVLVGLFVPLSPVAQERDQVDKAVQERSQLNQEVQQLSVYKQRYSELKQQMDALNKQLDTLKTIVPEEKETDEFIRLLQGAASASQVDIRRLKALQVASKDYYYEMPFEVQADGPYFNILDFFGRLSRLSRIINVGDLQFNDPETSKGAKYPMKPGTTVVGTFTATTYFTKPGDAAAPANAKPAGKN
ncbi:MAG TPA: type 4a pilus biogenesis protein PilO [Candidatus Acidoferrum sp.]|jgi:type IV pilus assembly protein PilO|nr:type 4a pilus biogenesis protein PilO [Candidatus Acidoferrum sp.]